jgi:hypothetical protein
MTNKKEVAQKIWNTYIGGYSELLMTPIEQFDTSMDDDIKKILAGVLREVVNQLKYQSYHHTEEYYQLDADDILRVADEMEQIK